MSAPAFEAKQLTHADLVKHAERWLKNQGCGAVLTELATTWETPDAIGFRSNYSVLVECKASRGDFLSDAEKPFRKHPYTGMGTFRFYMCPEGVIKPEDLPEKWGLIYVNSKSRRKMIVGPKGNIWSDQSEYQFKRHLVNEHRLLVSGLRRAQGR